MVGINLNSLDVKNLVEEEIRKNLSVEIQIELKPNSRDHIIRLVYKGEPIGDAYTIHTHDRS